MKPFDLEAAKRGDPIITRNGQSVKFIVHVPELDEGSRLYVRIGECPFLTPYYETGTHSKHGRSNHDLFMATKKRTVWFNVYKQGGVDLVPGAFCSNKEDAQYLQGMGPAVIKGSPFSIEIEE